MSRSILTRAQIIEIISRGETVFYKGRPITSLDDPDLPVNDAQILYDYPDWDLNPAAYASANAVGIDGYPIEGSPSNGETLVFNNTDRVWQYAASGGTGDVVLTASKAVITDSSGALAASNTTSTEVGYLSGVTSAIQPQLSSKMTTLTYDTNSDGYVDNSTALKLIVHNMTGAIVPKGSIVYINGSTGTHPTIALAQASTELTSSKTIGAVVSTLNIGDVGEVIVQGTLENQNTQGYTAGDMLWLSTTTAGGVTTTKPSAPNHAVFIGYVSRVNQNNGKIVYRILNGYELDELHNVSISSPTTGQALVYNSTTELWSNQTMSVTPAGSDSNIQYNNSGTLDGSNNFKFNASANTAVQILSTGAANTVLGITGASTQSSAIVKIIQGGDNGASCLTLQQGTLSTYTTNFPLRYEKANGDLLLGVRAIPVLGIYQFVNPGISTGRVAYEVGAVGSACGLGLSSVGGQPTMLSGGAQCTWWDGISGNTVINQSYQLAFGNSGLSFNVGLAREASGVLRVTNGSTSSGKLLIGIKDTVSGGQVHIVSSAADVTGLRVDSAASPTTPILDVRVGTTSDSGIKVDASTTSGDTRFLLYDVTSGTMKRVLVGANDSGGTGYRILRILNS